MEHPAQESLPDLFPQAWRQFGRLQHEIEYRYSFGNYKDDGMTLNLLVVQQLDTSLYQSLLESSNR